MSLVSGHVVEMKPTENVWDAIAADLAAVTAATDGPDEKSWDDRVAEIQITKNSECSRGVSVVLHVESGVKETQDGTGGAPNKEASADIRFDTVRDTSGLSRTDEAQGGVNVGNGPHAEPVVPKRDGAESKVYPASAQNVIEVLTDSSEEYGNNHSDDLSEEDKSANILGKRNRTSDHKSTGGSGKKLKVKPSVSNDAVEISDRDQGNETPPSGENSTKAQELQHKSDRVEPLGGNIHLPAGLENFYKVFTSLNSACGYLLKQQLVASWQNVKHAMEQFSGTDSETISIEDVRRLAQLCPRIVILSQFSGEGEDATFHVELADPADAVKVDLPGSTKGVGTVNAQGNGTSDPTSAGKQVSDLEAKIIVDRRQKAFQMSLAQMAHQFQVPQSSYVHVNGEEPVKHPGMHPHPAILRHPNHEGHHTMGPPMLPLPPTQSIVLPPPPLLPQQLQHSYMNMPGGYPGMPFPLPVPPATAFGPFGTFPQLQQTNNYAGYQLSNLPHLPPLSSAVPSTSQPSTVPPNSSVPHRSPTGTAPPTVDAAESPAPLPPPEPSPYHGMSLNKAKRRRSRNWDTWEVILLVQAKKSEWERSESSSGKDRFETSVERWKKVEKFLKENKVVDRDAMACKNKWESILSDYKSIKDWNRKPGNTVYSLLNPTEKKIANLPVIFASSLLELMDTFQGKSTHIQPPAPVTSAPAPPPPPPPPVVDSMARNNTPVSGEDASGAEDSGEARASALGDGTHGSAGRRKRLIGGSSPLVAAFDRLSANVLNIEKGRDERSERIWALENRKYDLEKCKFELQARKVDAEREDRKGLVRVLGNLAGAFHRMADKM